jgi:hypothetical protein
MSHRLMRALCAAPATAGAASAVFHSDGGSASAPTPATADSRKVRRFTRSS